MKKGTRYRIVFVFVYHGLLPGPWRTYTRIENPNQSLSTAAKRKEATGFELLERLRQHNLKGKQRGINYIIRKIMQTISWETKRSSVDMLYTERGVGND
jgi:hypothetical protein